MFKKFCDSIDLRYTENIIDDLSNFGDDPITGNRSAGSEACTLAAKYLYEKFKDVGLISVTMDSYLVNGWTFNGGSLIYKDGQENLNKITLGGYATNFNYDNENLKLVYGGKGTLSELEALGDIANKLVLISPLNTSSDYWVSFPAYQSYLKGAAGVIVAATHDITFDDNLISNNISLPPYCKALSISIKDANILKDLINSSNYNKELPVTLSVNSEVKPYEPSYNIWGEIKGRTDEVIYLIAHYDGYYNSYFDDACGVSEILGIAKGIINSKYIPNKTIRVIAHSAEEWGKGYSPFDWASGSYEQIFNLHPEWSEKAFALINIDGNYPISKERNFTIYTSHELYDFVKSITPSILSNYPDYNFTIKYPTPLIYEDFNYQKAGIPTITAGEDIENSIYYKSYYHSSMDKKSTGFDRDTHKLIQVLYGYILICLDSALLRPVDFTLRFKELYDNLPLNSTNTFKSLINDLCYYSNTLSYTVKNINFNPNLYKSRSSIINSKLYTINRKIQDNLLALDYKLSIVFPHTLSEFNSRSLYKAIYALENSSESLENVLNNHILPIDLNYCALDYDKLTYDFITTRYSYGATNTFAEKMFINPNEDLYSLINVLNSKISIKDPDLSKEITTLKVAYNNQTAYLKEAVFREYVSCTSILIAMKDLLDYI